MSLEVTFTDEASPFGVLLRAVPLRFSSLGRMVERILQAAPADIRFGIVKTGGGQFKFYTDTGGDWQVGQLNDQCMVLASALPSGNSKAYTWNGRINAAGDPAVNLTLNGSAALTLAQIVNAFARGDLIHDGDFPNDFNNFGAVNALVIDQIAVTVAVGDDGSMTVSDGLLIATLGQGSGLWE